MNYTIKYACVSDIGKKRSINQDNYICEQLYRKDEQSDSHDPLYGDFSSFSGKLLGVFDGMGGEMCGEVASYIAAENAVNVKYSNNGIQDLINFCQKANDSICQYQEENHISRMGTTAAVLQFTGDKIFLCNIGDSKIFHYSGGEITQISMDHVVTNWMNGKPPLTQNLGISPEEMQIQPYFAVEDYQIGDRYVISSDGLTDLVSNEEIADIIRDADVCESTKILLEKALERGGYDNITIIVCAIELGKGNDEYLTSESKRFSLIDFITKYILGRGK